MDNRNVFGVFLGVIVSSQVALAQTTSITDNQNRVTIVVNKNATKPVKKVLTHKKKIAVAHKVQKNIRPVVITNKSIVPAKKKVVAATSLKRTVLPITGRRVTLANQGYAHANGFNGEDLNPVTPNTSSLPAAPNLTSRLKKQEEQNEESQWGIKYRTYNAIDTNALENYGSTRDYTIRAWDRLSISYKLNPDISLILMPQYYHTWFQDQNRVQSTSNPGLTQSYASYLGDTGLYLDDKNIASFGDKNASKAFVFGGSQAYFAPTSQAAQTAGSYGETRTNLNLSKSYGKLDLKWTEEFRYYFQQYETNAYLDSNGNPITNTAYRLLNLMDIGYNFTSKLNFTIETGVVNEGDYGDSYNGGAMNFVDYLVMNPDLGYTFTKNLSLDLGVWEVYDYTNPPTLASGQTASYSPFAPYNGNSSGSWAGTEVYLMGTVKF